MDRCCWTGLDQIGLALRGKVGEMSASYEKMKRNCVYACVWGY